MSAEKFECIKRALKVKKLPKSLTLADQFWSYFKEIANQQYHFNRINVEASILRAITKDEVVSFFMVINSMKISLTFLKNKFNFRIISHHSVSHVARYQYTCYLSHPIPTNAAHQI